MPRNSPTSNPKHRSRKYAPKETGIQSNNLQGLQGIREAEVSRYTTVKNTNSAYNGHCMRGRAFLKGLITKRKQDETNGPSNDGICTAILEKAFDSEVPNKYSALALEMFLVHKCFNEGCGKDTADGIYSAFAAFWDNIDGGHYAGEYTCDEATGEIKGCPARASNVKAVVLSIKTREKSKGASAFCNHAEAMPLEELQHLMQWSTKECPDEWLTEDRWRTEVQDSVNALKHRLEHGFMRGFMSSGFTLWTRCFELLSLQAGDLKEDCFGPAPYYIPHFKVELLDQKGWQHEKGYDGPREACLYDIYKQEVSAIDMNTHLLRWKAFLENVIERKLTPEDYLFPHIGVNGVICTMQQMSYDSLQAMLADFCEKSGTKKRYTTHSFRRGGAQYRFMFAPIGQRWSLNRIRWWGGWAVGEQCDTLIKYLVDSLQSFENGHGDALHPIPIDPSNFFMGDHNVTAPATTEEVRQLSASMNRNIQTLTTTVESVLSQTMTRQTISQPPMLGGGPMEGSNLAVGFSYGHSQLNQLQTTLPAPGGHFQVGLPQNDQEWNSQMTAVPHQDNTTFLMAGSAMSCNSISQHSESRSGSRSVSLSPPPIAGVSIPALGHASGAWHQALKQWTEVDPQTGLALKDWPAKWYTGLMRDKTGSLRSQQQVIFEEYERLGSDVNRFLEVYPDADRSNANLLKEIRQRTRQGRSSKNGTPEARASASRSGSVMSE